MADTGAVKNQALIKGAANRFADKQVNLFTAHLRWGFYYWQENAFIIDYEKIYFTKLNSV